MPILLRRQRLHRKLFLTKIRSPYTYGYWNGTYVFIVTPEEGFVMKGKVTHGAGADICYGNERVLSYLYTDNVIYTISSRMTVMSWLENPDTPLNSIILPSPVYRWMYPAVK